MATKPAFKAKKPAAVRPAAPSSRWRQGRRWLGQTLWGTVRFPQGLGFWRGLRLWLLRLSLLWLVITLLPVLALRFVPPVTTSFMLQGMVGHWFDGGSHPSFSYRWRSWDQIGWPAKLAVMASEDQNFPDHWGFDLEALEKAWKSNKKGKRIRGGSTISQQVAKNLFLWGGRSYVRKGLEAYFTLLIEATWPKQRILEVYLNIAEFGDNTYGVESAAQRFFNKPASLLNSSEASRLAAVLPNPILLKVQKPSGYVWARSRWISGQMNALGKEMVYEVEDK
jgi:monofunctional biosynthetic peptidoglycan transglycosylase